MNLARIAAFVLVPFLTCTAPEKTRTEVKLEPAALGACVGGCELTPGFVIAITLEGEKLMAQATGQPKFEIFASAPAEFFCDSDWPNPRRPNTCRDCRAEAPPRSWPGDARAKAGESRVPALTSAWRQVPGP